jgi:hypothetical protein
MLPEIITAFETTVTTARAPVVNRMLSAIEDKMLSEFRTKMNQLANNTMLSMLRFDQTTEELAKKAQEDLNIELKHQTKQKTAVHQDGELKQFLLFKEGIDGPEVLSLGCEVCCGTEFTLSHTTRQSHPLVRTSFCECFRKQKCATLANNLSFVVFFCCLFIFFV